MPTSTGRPKVGEILIWTDTGARAEVLERTSGLVYSVRLRFLDSGRERWMTEAGWWLQHGWVIERNGQHA